MYNKTTSLTDFLNTHPSKKRVPHYYDDGVQVRKFQAEEYTLIFDRANNRKFIMLPNSVKREEIS